MHTNIDGGDAGQINKLWSANKIKAVTSPPSDSCTEENVQPVVFGQSIMIPRGFRYFVVSLG